MNNTETVKNKNEKLSERVDSLEIALLLILNSLTSVKSFKIDDVEYNVIGKIPMKTMQMIESIIVKNKKV